jgi:hypothetical protein
MSSIQLDVSNQFDSGRKKIHAILQHIHKTKEDKIRRLEKAAKNSNIPWSQELLDNICSLPVRLDILRVLEYHSGFEIHERVKAVQDAKIIFDCALEELDQHLHEYEAFFQESQNGGSKRKHREERFELLIRKSVLTVAASAKSIEDYERRLMKLFQIKGYQEELEKIFKDNPLHNFVKGLRNILQHVRVIEASWQMIYNDKGREFSVKLNKRQILLHPDQLNAKAKEYLSGIDGDINLRFVFFEYAKHIDEMFNWIFTNITDKNYHDYCHCKVYIERSRAKIHIKHMISLLLHQKTLNAYEHLDKYFDKEEVVQILSLNRPEERADMVIMLMDESSICDNELRQLVYSLFRRAQELSPAEKLSSV